ncbi:MAG: site-2 protease family protein [Deltaproteobacteria bacterium]|nr:site-2 protease family protein [Deltaproteobacteria bacterium]
MLNLSLERIREAVVFLIALILSIAVHEFGHALVADKLGDRTPRYQGRVTLNPLAHADLFGTIIFPLVGLLMQAPILFGWGKPVLVNPAAFTRKLRQKIGHLLVAAAGPAMNVVLALLVTLIYFVVLATGIVKPFGELARGIEHVIGLNWVLVFFNLIPCPPLDGGAVLAGLLPDRYNHVNEFLRQYGFIILIGLLVTGLTSIFVRPALYLTTASIRLVYSLLA